MYVQLLLPVFNEEENMFLPKIRSLVISLEIIVGQKISVASNVAWSQGGE